MLKKIIATGLVAIALMFSGCGETDKNGADKLAAQNAIDKGNPSDAINIILGGRSLSTALASMNDDDKMTLASAYMSNAGFGMTDIVSIALSEDTNTTSAFDSFKTKVSANSSTASLGNVNNAIACYKAISTTTNAPSKAATIPSVSDEDLKLALATLVKAVLLYNKKITATYTLSQSNTEIAGFINEVFTLLKNMDGLQDLQKEIDKVKVDIASKSGVSYLPYVDGTDYSAVSVDANDVNAFR